jgi:hypothetical protein
LGTTETTTTESSNITLGTTETIPTESSNVTVGTTEISHGTTESATTEEINTMTTGTASMVTGTMSTLTTKTEPSATTFFSTSGEFPLPYNGIQYCTIGTYIGVTSLYSNQPLSNFSYNVYVIVGLPELALLLSALYGTNQACSCTLA